MVSGGILASATLAGGVTTKMGIGSEKTKFDDGHESMGYFVDFLFQRDINPTGP